jgi:hypothetical protein
MRVAFGWRGGKSEYLACGEQKQRRFLREDKAADREARRLALPRIDCGFHAPGKVAMAWTYSVVAALSMSVMADIEHARAEQLDNPESIYRACADMKLFNQEVLRVILLDTRYRHISTVEITKGSINESLAYPRDIFVGGVFANSEIPPTL